MNMMMNRIYLRRAGKLMVKHSTADTKRLPKGYLAAALRNLQGLGYTLSPALFRAVQRLSREAFEQLYYPMIADLRRMVGAHVNYAPLFPGFPEQVMQEDEAELYFTAMYHYYTWEVPDAEPVHKGPLQEQVTLKVIELGSLAEFRTMIRQLIESNGSISAEDQKDIDAVIANTPTAELDELLPPEIPFKENAGFVASSLLKHEKADVARISPYFTTATDVLRLAVAWSDGDVSLALPTRFRKFKRRERRLLLGLLERCQTITEDMLRLQAFKVDQKEQGSASLSPGDTQALAAISEFGAKPYTDDEKKELSEIVQSFNDRHGTQFSESDMIRFEQVNRDILDDNLSEMLRNNPPDVVYSAFAQAFFQGAIRMFQRDNEMRNIVLSDPEARDKATRHFFNRALREAREAS